MENYIISALEVFNNRDHFFHIKHMGDLLVPIYANDYSGGINGIKFNYKSLEPHTYNSVSKDPLKGLSNFVYYVQEEHYDIFFKLVGSSLILTYLDFIPVGPPILKWHVTYLL